MGETTKRLRWYWAWLWESHMFWLGKYLVFLWPCGCLHWQREPYCPNEGKPRGINWKQTPRGNE